MFRTRPTSAYVLSAIIAILIIVASAGGLFIADLYRDNAFTTSAWRATDLVTLAVAAPLLIAALALAARGSFCPQLIWLAMLDYTLYNYAYYLFGTAFNRFFLIYVALFTLSIFALIFALANIDASSIPGRFRPRTPVRWIAGYMAFVGLGLGGLWVAQSLSFVATGQVPTLVTQVEHPTSIVFALDLSLVVPFLILGAIWLWRRRPWGYVLAGILSVKGTVYMLALAAVSAGVLAGDAAGPSAELPLWLALGLGFLLASGFLLGNVRPAPEQAEGKPQSHSAIHEG